MNKPTLFYKIINYMIRILGACIVFVLFLHSIFSTSFMGIVTGGDGSPLETTLNIRDYPLRHLLVFVVFVFLAVLLYCFYMKYKQKLRSFGITEQRVMHVLTLFAFIMATLFVLGTQLAPGSDPAKIYAIAMQWRKGNFSSFAEGGYLFRYPFQSGIVLFYYLLTFLMGVNNYVGIQFVNVLALVACYTFVAKLSGRIFRKDECFPVLGYVIALFWVPIIYYTAYLYGILPGMAFSLAATCLTLDYLEKRRYRDMIGAALCIGIAIVLKSNCLIYLVAFMCFLFYDMIDQWIQLKKNAPKGKEKGEQKSKTWILSLICIVLMLISYVGFTKLYENVTETVTGYELPEGEAMVSWVVMGLQETPQGPGGYSGYIGDVFTKYHFDSKLIKQASVNDIKAIVKRMVQHPLTDGVGFFARKSAFQWNDPTYIAMNRTKGRTSAIEVSTLFESLIDGMGSVGVSIYLNYMQTLIWIGLFLYLYLSRKSENIYELMGVVVFIGGYLFHFFWEASPSYTMPYVFLILPYAAKGFLEFVRFVVKQKNMIKTKKWDIKRRDVVTTIVVCVLVTAGIGVLSTTHAFARTIALDDGADAREQFYTREEKKIPLGGYYRIRPYANEDVYLAQKNDKVILANDDLEDRILIEKAENGYMLRFRSNEQVLAAFGTEDKKTPGCYMDDSMNMYFESRNDVDYYWRLQKVEDGVYYILNGQQALTMDENGSVTLQLPEEADTQKFVLMEEK